MPTVIGIDEAQVKQATCGNCASRMKYVQGDVRTLWEGKDISGGADGARGFSCPTCGQNVITERW